MENNWVFQPLQMPVSVLIFISVIMAVTAWVSYSNWNRRRGTGVGDAAAEGLVEPVPRAAQQQR